MDFVFLDIALHGTQHSISIDNETFIRHPWQPGTTQEDSFTLLKIYICTTTNKIKERSKIFDRGQGKIRRGSSKAWTASLVTDTYHPWCRAEEGKISFFFPEKMRSEKSNNDSGVGRYFSCGTIKESKKVK